MKFEIPYSKSTSAIDAYKIIETTITTDFLKKAYKVKAELDYDSNSLSMNAKGKGFDLSMNFTDTKALGEIKLGFLLKALSGSIVSKIKSGLEGKI